MLQTLKDLRSNMSDAVAFMTGDDGKKKKKKKESKSKKHGVGKKGALESTNFSDFIAGATEQGSSDSSSDSSSSGCVGS